MTQRKGGLLLQLCIGAWCASAVAACEKKKEQPHLEGEPRREVILSGARIESSDYVANRIADVRCQRETTCMDIGPGHRFENRDVCVADLRQDALGHLSRSECSRGVDPRALEQCLEAIRSEVCPRVLEELNHLPQCKGNSMCFQTD